MYRNKAVAEGAVSHYLGNVVSARVARLTYGVEIVDIYDSTRLDHYSRRHKLHARPSGRLAISDAYSSILTKVCDYALAASPFDLY